jgi:hypothetical protein
VSGAGGKGGTSGIAGTSGAGGGPAGASAAGNGGALGAAGGGGIADASSPDAASPQADAAADAAGGRDGASTDSGAGQPEAGARPDAGDANDAGASADPCGADAVSTGATPANTRQGSAGFVAFVVSPSNEISSLVTTLTVPEQPPASGTLFLWPGLQPLPGGRNYDPINNGVLQPVLTWGPSCAPHSPTGHTSWWISSQYVNTFGSNPGFTGCKGGDAMNVAVGDDLLLEMTVVNRIWTQTATDLTNQRSVSFDFDLQNQAQGIAELVIETSPQKPVGDVVFKSTVITFASPEAAACRPNHRGPADTFTTPRVSKDGRRCCIDRITLHL